MSSIEVDLSANFTNSDNAGINVKKYANKKLNVNLHIKFYNYSELINNDNIELKDKCLQLLVKNEPDLDINNEPITSGECIISTNEAKKLNLLHSFIDKFMTEKANNKLEEYKMIKIADPEYINNMINNIKTMEDLSPNGAFLNGFSSLVYATLLPFNDDGLTRIQKIYTWLKRHNQDVEVLDKNNHNVCHIIRCSDKRCDNPTRSIKIIFCYIVRVYNQENPDNILTYGLETSKDFSEVLRYISINVKHFTNYSIFSQFVIKYINLYRVKNEPEFKKICKIDVLGNIIDKYIFKNKKEEDESDEEEDDKPKSGFFNYMNSIFYM
jgi:hypothetical protein